jgi:PAS domain S-box-containing protein
MTKDKEQHEVKGKSKLVENTWLSNVLDCVKIQGLMEDFYSLTGYGMAVVDLEGNVLIKTGWQDICEHFHRCQEQCYENCVQSDTELSKGTLAGEFRLYQCKNHLWDIATPIFVQDQQVGNIFFGQFLFEDEEPDLGVFKAQAQEFGFDEAKYLDALKHIPRYDKSTIASIMSFYTKLAALISSYFHNQLLLEQSLQEQDHMLNSLNLQSLVLDQISDCVTVTDLNGIISYVNMAESEVSGHTKAELIGQHVLVYGEDPTTGATQDEIYRETLEKGQFRGVVTNTTKDGKRKEMEVRTSLVYDLDGKAIAMCGTSIDISERVQNMQRLFFQRKADKVMLDLSSHMLNARAGELDEIIAEALDRIGTLLDLDRVYVFKKDESQMVMNNDYEWCKEGINAQKDILQGIPCSFNPNWMEALRSDGLLNVSRIDQLPDTWRIEKETLALQDIISVLAAPLKIKGELIGFLGFDSVSCERNWTDVEITVLKMTANLISSTLERVDYELRLIRAKEEAEHSNRVKSTFLAIVNHELRTPLNHILGYSQLLETDLTSPDAAEYVSQIKNSGSNLLKIIKDIFDLAVSEQSQILPQPILFDLQEHFEDNQKNLRDILNASGKQDKIQLIFSPDTAFSQPKIFADSSKINMVLNNLFKNAVKFSVAGSIEFGYDYLADDMIRYYLKDTGIGISQQQQQVIFDLFAQVEDVNTRKYGGMGIGLAISKKLAEILGGRLYLQSCIGEGSTFFLEIPTIVHSQTHGSEQPDQPRSDMDLRGKHIMVVDDENSILMLFKHYLRRSGAVLHLARNGEDAIDSLSVLPEGSVILMDLQMPVMDGYEATRQIKSKRNDLYILALSGFATDAEEPALKRSGFDAVIPKPVSKKKLFEALQDFSARSV